MNITKGDPTFYIKSKYVQNPIFNGVLLNLFEWLGFDCKRIVWISLRLHIRHGEFLWMKMDERGNAIEIPAIGDKKLYNW